MKTESDLLKEYDKLIHSTTHRVTRNFRKSRHINQYEDFAQIATIAAWKAIKSYKKGNNTKLSTYIVKCITNQLIDLDRSANKLAAPTLIFSEETIEPQSCAKIQPTLDCYSLEDDEKVMLKKIMRGKTMKNLVIEKRFAKHTTYRNASREVKKCLHRITQKLTYNEASQII